MMSAMSIPVSCEGVKTPVFMDDSILITCPVFGVHYKINILKQLQHRAIVAYIEAGIDWDGKPYILMPLIEGVNLREAVAGHDLQTILQVFAEILMALDYAHSLNIIHRDLKPSNILVRSSDHQPIIVDFGCAYLLDNADASSLTTTLVGSLGYIPSEVMSNPKLRSPLHDVFACGVMLYEVLAGTRPDLHDYQPLARVKKEFGVIDPVIRDAIAPASARIGSASSFLSRIRGL
jgi:serine/threonine protein kinase